MKLVSTGLTAETLEKQLSAEVTEGQREEGLPHLSIKHTIRTNQGSVTTSVFTVRHWSLSTNKVVGGERHILQHFYMQLLSCQPGDVCIPANRLLLSETGSGELGELSTPHR